MDIQERVRDRRLTLEFSGELDHHGARNALRRIDLALDAALPRTLALDFGGVTFMDSSGIALILRARNRMELLDGTVQLRNVPDQARRVLDAAGIGKLIDMDDKRTDRDGENAVRADKRVGIEDKRADRNGKSADGDNKRAVKNDRRTAR